MCVSCGCGQMNDDHGDERNITMKDMRSAAQAADIDVQTAARNIQQSMSQSGGAGQQQSQMGGQRQGSTGGQPGGMGGQPGGMGGQGRNPQGGSSSQGQQSSRPN